MSRAALLMLNFLVYAGLFKKHSVYWKFYVAFVAMNLNWKDSIVNHFKDATV